MGLQCVGVVEKVHNLVCKRFLGVPLKTPMCMGILEGTTCLSIRVYELLNTGLNLHMKENRLPKNKPTTCKLTWNWMANVFGLLNSGICCVNLALVLFSCKRVLGMKRPFWQFSRNDSVIILTKRGLPLLTAVRVFVYISASLKSNILTGNYLDFVRIKYFRDVLIKLRMGVLPLNATRFRYAHENHCLQNIV